MRGNASMHFKYHTILFLFVFFGVAAETELKKTISMQPTPKKSCDMTCTLLHFEMI